MAHTTCAVSICMTAVAADANEITRTLIPLGTPANYTAMLANASENSYSVIKWQAPYCRSCKAHSPLLDRIASELPSAEFYSMDLIRDGKAAGKRMLKFFKEHSVSVMPFIEVYRGDELIEAGPDSELAASDLCVFTPTSISCSEPETYSMLRQLMVEK